MDKNAIKKYAIWARRELISRVSQRAYQYGIREDNIVDANADSIDGKLLLASEKKERQALIAQVKEKGFEHVMEEVAYTWFNRFSALRFMEVNGYLPTHMRVFTDENNNFKPQIITEAIHLELDGLDMDKVYELKEADNNDELFKYLLITQCNALNKILPGMFQKIADYTELLFPDNLLREGSVIEQMTMLIPEENWKDAVQIIGWLYQYYNSEPKDTVFVNLKKNIKITKDNIPAATQLFTPDWIVRYMVENSLGRLWLEGHPNDELKSEWKYYLDEAEQEANVQAQLDKIREEYKTIKPEEIRVLDPCMGSGHILVYAFDVLMQIYEAYGFNQRDAAKSIVENNIFGLDIDERAAQLAYFAVMMKALEYDKRFLRKDKIPQPHVYANCESNYLDPYCVEYFVNGNSKLKVDMEMLIAELHDAKEYGSILDVTNVNFDAMYARFDEIRDDINIVREAALNELLPFVQVAQVMAQKYDAVVTNPPYMGSSSMGAMLGDYVKKNYSSSKSDLFAVFIEKCSEMSKPKGYYAMITQHAWMFLSSFEKLRIKLLLTDTVNMAHLGARAFDEIGGEVVQTTAFVRRKSHLDSYKGMYARLVEPTTQQGKEDMFLCGENRYVADQGNFSKIPGSPITYWVSTSFVSAFDCFAPIRSLAEGKVGLQTGNNDVFLRLWFEIENSKISFDGNKDYKWFPYNKGGSFRRWYGNCEYILDWEYDGVRVKNYKGSFPRNTQYYFSQGITWSDVATGLISMRIMKSGFVFDTCAPCLFSKNDSLEVLAFFNTKVAQVFMDLMSPTMHYTCGTVVNVPYIKPEIDVTSRVKNSITIAQIDWNSFETSWDFTMHPLVQLCHGVTADDGHEIACIEDAYNEWESDCNDRVKQLKANEEELNRIFIDIYGLQDELTPEVEDKDVTVRKADLQRDVKSMISYAVGCMFGRYSLDVPGLAYAGGDWNASKYKTYPTDEDNIIPICDDEYFPDDIVGRFVKFIETVYGKETLEENLKFIADALGRKGMPRDVIRNYFLNDFYADHLKIYQKRPIYWLFDSGKKNGFKALIYMHRYQPDTIARMRTDYVHEQQERYRTAIAHLEQRINDASTGERVKLNKQLGKLKDQATEIRTYEEKIHHLADQMIRIDLDDGVKHNYEIFKDVLAKIK